jgi:hypothetical protein
VALPPPPTEAGDPTDPSPNRLSKVVRRHAVRRRIFVVTACSLLVLIAAGGIAIGVIGTDRNSGTAAPKTHVAHQVVSPSTSAAHLVSPPTTPSTRPKPPPPPADPFTNATMASFLKSRQGLVTAAVYNVTTGQTYLLHPGVTEQTASIVKVDILATLLWQLEQSSQPLGEEEAEQATGMIEQSDNDDATDLWNDDGGAPGVAHFNSVIGLADTTPNYHWGETTTTALDQVHLVRLVAFPNQFLGPASRSYELGLMENVVGWEDWGVSSGPPTTATVALKNGWVPLTSYTDWQVNSIGYVSGSGRRYILAVLTAHDSSEGYGISSIEGISKIVWSALGPNSAP